MKISLLILLLASTLGARAQNLAEQRVLQARVDKWVEPYIAAHDFSGVVLIAQDQRILVEKSYGCRISSVGGPTLSGLGFALPP